MNIQTFAFCSVIVILLLAIIMSSKKKPEKKAPEIIYPPVFIKVIEFIKEHPNHFHTVFYSNWEHRYWIEALSTKQTPLIPVHLGVDSKWRATNPMFAISCVEPMDKNTDLLSARWHYHSLPDAARCFYDADLNRITEQDTIPWGQLPGNEKGFVPK